METLSELIYIVNRKRLSKVDVLDRTFLNGNNQNLYFQLYNAIEKKQINSDEEGAKLLYDSKKSDPRYRMLKSRLKDKVMNSILLLDATDTFNNEAGRAYYNCITHCQRIEVLIQLTGTTKLICELVKENYHIALKYKFYDILRNYSLYLINYYGLKGDNRSLLKEEPRYLLYSDYAQKMQFAKYLYNKMIVNFVGGISITNEFLIKVNEDIEVLKQIKLELGNVEIDFYYYYIALLYFDCKNEIEQILSICREAETLMKNEPLTITNTRQTAILLYKMKALLHTRQWAAGIKILKNANTIKLSESNYNWFTIKEFEFKLYLQDNKIEEATRVYQEVVKNKYLKRQVEQLSEKWKILNAYLVFMDSYINKGDFKFSLFKFLNDVPVNSKDKSGYNFAIRVIEMMYMFGRKEYNFVFQKIDALRVYRTRYLNDNTYKRNHLFLSVLLKAEKLGFNGREMQKADWPELQELRTQNNHIIADWEIIPYETLWEIIVNLAKK